MKKSLLFISIEYPKKPGPGACRNFFFCRDIADNGWDVNVLTVKENALQGLDDSFNSFNSKAKVHRTATRDSTKIFSIFGKYPKFIEIPDRWLLWLFTAIPKGLRLIRKYQPDIIYVSYPSYANLLVAVCLHKLTKKKLIVELRDPFRYRYDGKNVPSHWLYRWIEKISINNAHAVITTTKECLTLYKQWFPSLNEKPTACFKNGFIPIIHTQIKVDIIPSKNQKFTLLHSGSLYQIGRNPFPLLKAVQQLKNQGIINNNGFELVFRGCEPWHDLVESIKQMDISDLITFKSTINYFDSIKEMYLCDSIIIIQEEIFNSQIPSKLYDSIACQKPIIALTPANSALSNELQTHNQVPGIQSPELIANRIKEIISSKYTVNNKHDTKQIQRSVINNNLTDFLTKLIK